jgi:hypothetical protein
MLFPVTGTKEQIRAIFSGPYGTEAGKEYVEKNDKPPISIGEPASGVGKQAFRVLKAVPIVGDVIGTRREKAPAAKRTELRKAIFEGVKGKAEARTGPNGKREVYLKYDDADDAKDVESDMERFMWQGGQWSDLNTSLKQRYATDDEITAVKQVWNSRKDALDAAGKWEEIKTKRFQIQKQEKAENEAEKKELEAERDKRAKAFKANPNSSGSARAFRVKKAG